MNINATLFGQMITFAIFIWITCKYIWPLFAKILDERQSKIAHDISNAEQRVRDAESMQHKAHQELSATKIKSADILDEANKRAGNIIDEARGKARLEGERLIQLANAEIAQQTEQAKQALRENLAELVIKNTEKLLRKRMDQTANDELLNQLITEI
ncbi:MAG: F0F1 ATP synthase subunit B [Legionellales bacterium]|nr:F0F1 ATP synthase subunit B [Legionellales bacterium]